MSNILWFACLAFLVVSFLKIIAASILKVSKSPVASKIFQIMEYTTTVTSVVVVSLWIASLIFGI